MYVRTNIHTYMPLRIIVLYCMYVCIVLYLCIYVCMYICVCKEQKHYTHVCRFCLSIYRFWGPMHVANRISSSIIACSFTLSHITLHEGTLCVFASNLVTMRSSVITTWTWMCLGCFLDGKFIYVPFLRSNLIRMIVLKDKA